MFENFPKTRPPLPEEIERIYATHYASNRKGETAAASLSQRMESWLHHQVSSDVKNTDSVDKTTLELGAGTLNQLQYEPNVQSYDIVEPFADLFKDSPLLARVNNVYADIAEVPASARYDRITSVAVLEHICDLPDVIATCGLMLSENGVLRSSIPSEGTLLWTLGWKLTTGLEFRLKHGLDYGLLMKHEHVNTAKEIEQVLNYFFKDVKCKVFGLSKAWSLYQYYECRNPIVERCQQYSKHRPHQ